MKSAPESPPWVPIVAGVLVLLAAGLAVRQCGTSPPPDGVTEAPRAAESARGRAARLNNQPGGWSAQSAQDGLAGESRRVTAPSGRNAGSGSMGTHDRGREADDAAAGREPLGSRRNAARDFRETDTMDTGGDAIAVPQHARQADRPKGGTAPESDSAAADAAAHEAAKPVPAQDQPAKANADKPGAATTQEVAQSNDPVKAAGADDSGPVLSLPLDKSVEPDQGGDNAPIIASGVTFDANGAHFSNNAQLLLPSDGNVNPAAGTFTFWILPDDWAGDTESVLQILHLGATTWANRFDIFKDHVYLRLLMCPDSGYESGSGANVSNWQKGDRHMITATWGDGVVDMYIDGVSVGANDYDGQLDIGSSPPLFLGSGNPRVPEGAHSNITNFQMFTRALGADEVATLFAQSAP